MRILRQIELGWPVVDAAQRQMLDGVEADHAQGESVPPAPQGFLGHLIAREFSQEACRDGEARSGIGGGGRP